MVRACECEAKKILADPGWVRRGGRTVRLRRLNSLTRRFLLIMRRAVYNKARSLRREPARGRRSVDSTPLGKLRRVREALVDLHASALKVQAGECQATGEVHLGCVGRVQALLGRMPDMDPGDAAGLAEMTRSLLAEEVLQGGFRDAWYRSPSATSKRRHLNASYDPRRLGNFITKYLRGQSWCRLDRGTRVEADGSVTTLTTSI